MKFSPAGGEIEIRTFLDDHKTGVTEVSDQGMGLKADLAESIMRGDWVPDDEKTHVKERGAGIGLQLCRDIMNRANGSFRLISRPEGGTTVRLGFPVSDRTG